MFLFFTDDGKSNDPGCPIKPGMTEKAVILTLFSVILAYARIQSLVFFSVILDPRLRTSRTGYFNRGSRVVILCSCPGACGRGCAPVPSLPYGGEDCLSEASSAAHTTGTGAQAPPLGGHARALMVLGPFAETKGPRRAGAKPRKKKPHRRKERKGGHPGPPLHTDTMSL